jgi:hypothetical protein
MPATLIYLWDLVADHAETVIALCALIFTAYQVTATRRHDRLSVKPLLCAQIETDITGQVGRLEVFLENHGLGPAVIDHFSIQLSGKALDFAHVGAAKQIFSEILGSAPTTYSLGGPRQGESLKADARLRIVQAYFEVKDHEEYLHKVRQLGMLELVVDYQSVYGNRQHLKSSCK